MGLAAVVAFITQLVRMFGNIIIYACNFGTNNEHFQKYLSTERNRYKLELKRGMLYSIK